MNFVENGKFNAVKLILFEFKKTFAAFGGPKVACSRDGARDFFSLFTGE